MVKGASKSGISREEQSKREKARNRGKGVTAGKNGGAFDDELFTALCSGVQAFTSISGFLLFQRLIRRLLCLLLAPLQIGRAHV